MGTGSTAVAALQLGRSYVGYDLSSEYIEISKARVEAQLSGKKFKLPKGAKK